MKSPLQQAPDFDKIALLGKLEASDKSRFARRQSRFEIDLLLRIIHALHPKNPVIVAEARAAADTSYTGDFGFDWFNQFMETQIPIRLYSYRLKKEVPFARIFQALESTNIFKVYQDYQDGWPDEDVALVIDMPGDGFSTRHPLVLRPDDSTYETEDAVWCIRLYTHGLAIGPFEDFLSTLVRKYQALQ